MGKFLGLVYGVVCYAVFLAVFLYLIAFSVDLGVPKTVSKGAGGSLAEALLVDVALMLLFGLQHSVMARAGFKHWLTRRLPKPIERSTYVLVSSAMFVLLFALAALPAAAHEIGQTQVTAVFRDGLYHLDVVVDDTSFAHATPGAKGPRLAALIVGAPKETR